MYNQIMGEGTSRPRVTENEKSFVSVSPKTLLSGSDLTASMVNTAGEHASLQLPPQKGVFTCLIGHSGVAIVYSGDQRFVATGGNFLMIDRRQETRIEFGRLVNEWLLLEGSTASGIASSPCESGGCACFNITDDPVLAGLRVRLIESLVDSSEHAESLARCFLLYAPTVEPTECHFHLATVPAQISGSLRTMLEQVVADPAGNWSLHRAAEVAAYSPFHLSRTFRSLSPYGFPEFVERLRCELATRALLGANRPLEDVAAATGFGSVSAMRAATREYTGFLPSELRGVDDTHAVVKT